jgi:hypothetical protein
MEIRLSQPIMRFILKFLKEVKIKLIDINNRCCVIVFVARVIR